MNRFVSKKALIAVGVLVLLGIGGFVTFSLVSTVPVTSPAGVVEMAPVPLHTVIGKSVEGRNIDAYQYGNGPIHLLFVGGIHGGYEWNSVALAYQLIDYLNQRPETISEKLTVAIVPSANPDGVYKVTGKSGRFTEAEIPPTKLPLGTGRFNAHDVDLNRNFDCKWKQKGMWQGRPVSAGTQPFSEPEAATLRDYVENFTPTGVVFWHSKANGVYASQCEKGILPETLTLMDIYADASGYRPIKTFDAYAVTGAGEDWLASIGIPAITVELKTHETVEWDQNLAGIKALLKFYESK